MNVSPDALLAIAAMALVTLATRLAGLFVPANFARTGRLAAAFAAMPVAVLTALIAPALLASAWTDAAAGALTILAAWRLPLPLVVGIGAAAAAGLRALAG
jgi:uncharacterized membrane protein